MSISAETMGRRVLRRAANLIETYGWQKGSYGDKKRGFCAMGAINSAAAGPWRYAAAETAERLLRVVIRKRTRDAFGSVTTYNDAQTRRRSQVLSAMRAAAALPHP